MEPHVCVRCFQTDNGMLIVKTLIKKIDITGNIDQQQGSSRPRSVLTPANITKLRASHSATKTTDTQFTTENCATKSHT